MHFFFLMLGVTFAALPPILASAVWVGGMALYYGSTMFGEPEHNGAPASGLIPTRNSKRWRRSSWAPGLCQPDKMAGV